MTNWLPAASQGRGLSSSSLRCIDELPIRSLSDLLLLLLICLCASLHLDAQTAFGVLSGKVTGSAGKNGQKRSPSGQQDAI
jgi:hypothetical protein